MNYGEIFLGWGLGIVSGPLFSFIADITKVKKIESAVKIEFIEERLRLAIGLFSISRKTNNCDREFLHWFKNELDSYCVYYPNVQEILTLRDSVIQLSEDRTTYEIFISKKDESFVIPKIELIAAMSALASLSSFSSIKQMHILAVLRYIKVANYHIDHLNNWDKMSFETQDENYRRVSVNSDVSLKAYFHNGKMAVLEMAKFIAEMDRVEF